MSVSMRGMRVERIDRIPIRLDGKVQRDARGYARIWGTVIRSNALLTYTRADGFADTHVEFVPESTVRDPEAIETLRFAPITMPHPPEMLDANNTGRYQIGSVIDVRYVESDDGGEGELQALHQITDGNALDRIDQGTVEISPGYTADVSDEPGEFGGLHYTRVQRGRRYNHNSFVDEARGGPTSRLHIDESRAVTHGLCVQVLDSKSEVRPMAKIKINDEEFEVPDAVATEFGKLRAAKDADPEPPKDENEARGDSAAAPTPPGPLEIEGANRQFEKLFAGLAEKVSTGVVSSIDSARRKREDERIAEEQRRIDAAEKALSEVKDALPAAYDPQGKTSTEIFRDAIVSKNPDFRPKADAALKDKDESRLRGMFDAVSMAPSANHPLGDDVPSPRDSDVHPMQRRIDAAKKIRSLGYTGDDAEREIRKELG